MLLYCFIIIDGAKIQRVDPTHPALRGFEIVYEWESVQEEDFGLGVIVMFMSAVLSMFVMLCLVLNDKNVMGASSNTTASVKSKRDGTKGLGGGVNNVRRDR